MNIRPFKVLALLLFLIPLYSCTPATYSKEKVKESVINLCKDEYDLDVEVKIIGSTLGVYIPIEGLVDKDLKLDTKAGEKIEDVALSIHRVIMSTDKPLKFYILTARDTETIGAEFVLTGYVYDVVRVRLLDISRGEYHKRILRDFKFNPIIAGEMKVRELFDLLNQNAPGIQQAKPLFYPIFAIGIPDSQKIDIVDIKAKELSDQEALFYVRTKEYYVPLSGFEVYKAIFPSGFINEYLILTNLSMFPNPIKEIVSKHFYTGTEIRQRSIETTYAQYKDLGYTGTDGLPKKDLDEGWFLARQIGRRIKMLFEEDKRLKQRFSVQSSDGTRDNKILTFKFDIRTNEPSIDDNQVIFSGILELAAKVFRSYSFEDFEGVELIDIQPGGAGLYLSKNDLELFRRGRIKIEDLI